MIGEIVCYTDEDGETQECVVIKCFKKSYSDLELDNLEEDDCKIQVWVKFTKPNEYGQFIQRSVCREELRTEDQILQQLWK